MVLKKSESSANLVDNKSATWWKHFLSVSFHLCNLFFMKCVWYGYTIFRLILKKCMNAWAICRTHWLFSLCTNCTIFLHTVLPFIHACKSIKSKQCITHGGDNIDGEYDNLFLQWLGTKYAVGSMCVTILKLVDCATIYPLIMLPTEMILQNC